ncbi:MAG: C10 family peptidase [Kiritimatiellae bacterium]|nr:C10 family peptidase [Kiritimatiellia bacterium]
MKTTAKTAFALLAMLAASTLWAVEVTSEQAKTAVANWISASSTRLESQFKSRQAESSKTHKTASGRAVYHAVNLKGGGFVVTSGDTRLSPIIAFSGTGRFVGDEASPFHALLRKNFVGAVTELERADGEASKAAKQGLSYGPAPRTAAEAEWASLLSEPKSYATGRTSVSDTRVGIMLKTKWGQDGGYADGGWGEYLPALDYYVFYPNLPNDKLQRGILPCGCVATAGAQLMYFWKYPTASIPQFSNQCTLDGKPFTARSIEGTFDWGNMFETWKYGVDPDPTLTQRKAVGKLAWNLCVALYTDWDTENHSGGAGPSYLAGALSEVFGYASARYINYSMDMADKPADFSKRMADFNNALYASLDAKMPVYLSLGGPTGDHTLVADGYGYVSGKRYAHLNFGWWEDGDAWYYMDDKDITPSDTPYTFTVFNGIGFNIHPTATGDVVSGRVLDASGAPVSGASVKLYDSSNKLKKTVTTGSKGIFAFRITAKGTYRIDASHSSTTETASKSVTIAALTKDGWWSNGNVGTGNMWGEDVSFPTWTPPVSRTLTLTPNNKSYGTVSGGGKYAAGTVVKLNASAKSGYAFAGWFTDKACTAKLNPTGYDNRSPEVQVAMPSANTTIYSKFITKADAKKSLKFTSSTKALATTPKKSMSGYEFSLSLGASSATLVTFSAKGLPYGLKLDPATGKITGTPVKPGYYDVTITVKDAAGNKITQIVKLTLGVLSWSKGDYYGTAYPFGKGGRPGYFTFNVAANGKVSGKVTYKGKAYSFKSECNYSSKLRLLFKPQITIGKKTFEPGYITIAQRTLALGGVVVEEGNDDNGLVLVQRPTGVVTETGQLAELIGQEFVLTKDSNYTPNLIDGDEIIVRVVDNDAVFMRGTIQGKTLYGTSVPLRVENYLKRGNGNCYILSAYLFDESLNYYRTIRIQATLYLQWSEERGTYWVLNPSCYIMEEE